MTDPASYNSTKNHPFDRKQQARDKRRAILIEAARLIRKSGFNNVSLSEVADQLGIAKPAIYYYFKNKEEILFECISHSFEIAENALSSARETRGSGRDKLEAYMRLYLLGHMTESGIGIPFQDSKSLGPEMRSIIDKRRRNRRDQLRALLRAGIADGSIRQCDPTVVIGSWAGAVGWVTESFDPKGKLKAEDISNEVTALFINGLRP